MCELCELVRRIDLGETKEEVLHNDHVFVAVYCNNPAHPGTPMAVYRRHEMGMPMEEFLHIVETMNDKFPGRKQRGAGMLTIKDHWHEHWILKEE